MKIRNLFCLASGALSGGNKILLKLASMLSKTGQTVDVFLWDNKKQPDWFHEPINILTGTDLPQVLANGYDLVYFANAFLVPMALPHLRSARGVLISQGYESYCYGSNYNECLSECQGMADIMRLPIPVIATSRSVQHIFERQLNKDSYYVPVGIDDQFFAEINQPATRSPDKERILMVGNYLQKCKAMQDGFEAIKLIAKDLPVTLVLITQQKQDHKALNKLDLDVEVHYMPAQIAEIFRSCDVFCCPSWYEGFGLPAIESFACGIPVVSTKNHGVSDFGVDGINLLLAEPNNPTDLSEKIKSVLNNPSIAQSLVANGFKTAQTFRYETMLQTFLDAQKDLLRLAAPPTFENKKQEMETLLLNLENEGVFTPLHVQGELIALSAQLQNILATISTGSSLIDEAKGKLELLRDKLQSYLHNPLAEYYPAFKSCFDTCQFVLSIADEPHLHQYISLLRTGKTS